VTDSIDELAALWDVHAVTDFSDQLVEVFEPVFARRPARGVTVPLSTEEMKALRETASSQGADRAALVRAWVREKLHSPN
jgi:hypothetical protein